MQRLKRSERGQATAIGAVLFFIIVILLTNFLYEVYNTQAAMNQFDGERVQEKIEISNSFFGGIRSNYPTGTTPIGSGPISSLRSTDQNYITFDSQFGRIQQQAISNMNFTYDKSGWLFHMTSGATGVTAGFSPSEGRPSPGSGTGSLFTSLEGPNLGPYWLNWTYYFTYSGGQPLSAYFSWGRKVETWMQIQKSTLYVTLHGPSPSLPITIKSADVNGSSPDQGTWFYEADLPVPTSAFSTPGAYQLNLALNVQTKPNGDIRMLFDDVGIIMDVTSGWTTDWYGTFTLNESLSALTKLKLQYTGHYSGEELSGTYSPSTRNLLGGTSDVSGTIGNLSSDDGVYMTFGSYASATSAQALYAHQETTTIGGNPYYLQNLTSADASGTTLSKSMAATGRQLFEKFVYPLTGVSSIPTSTWTMYYRSWRDAPPSITFDAVSSGNNGGGSTSISWSHTTGSSSNRIMIVGVSIRTTTVSVSSITYGSQSLTFIRADTHASATIRSELWYLIAPASGTATVTVTLSGTSKATGGSCTYSGVAQTSPIDVHGGGTGTGGGGTGDPSQSVTVTAAEVMLLGHLAITGSATTVSSEGSGQTMRWDQVTTGGSAASRNRGHGSDKGPVGTGSQTVSWTLSASANWAVSVVAFKPASSVAGHVDVDVQIRKSDDTIRSTLATNVANSIDLTTTETTLSATYSWLAYSVVDQTDYLEIDYYVDVTTACTGVNAYLRIDDNTLATNLQTRATNIMLPSEFTAEVEFTGSSNTDDWSQLAWTIDSSWTAASVNVTLQLYNYDSSQYPLNGDGYISYTSSGTPNTNATQTQTISTSPKAFRDTSSNWKIKVKGVKTTPKQFDLKADYVNLKVYKRGGLITTPVSQTLYVWDYEANQWKEMSRIQVMERDLTQGPFEFTESIPRYVSPLGEVKARIRGESNDIIFCHANQLLLTDNFRNRTMLTVEVKNSGPIKVDLVSLWVTNSTYRLRVAFDPVVVLAPGETYTYAVSGEYFTPVEYEVKVTTQRGNVANYILFQID